MRLRSCLPALVIALATLGPSRRLARADPRSSVEISVIHATWTDGGGSIDPRLRDVSELTRGQPFVRYNVYKLLDRTLFPLDVGKPLTDLLVNGRTLQVTLVDVSDDKSGKRYHVRAEIDDPGRRAFLKLLEVTTGASEPFFVGGQSFHGGTLFLEFVVRPG
ncbi:MAG: hypothetical protein M3O36_11650 [Myxococcota bacterium]|nr:hypothetical protein [Myxococcota bacterium]